METKHVFIGEYINKSPRERASILLRNYKDFKKYRERYKRNAVSLMAAMREYSLRPSDEDLGIRVQTTGGTSNITASKALERVCLEWCFEDMKVSKEMFPDPYELSLISTAVYEWDLMKKEYGILVRFIDIMKPQDRKIYLPYIRREKSVADLTHELCLEWESVRKRLYRIRKKLLKEVLPWFDEYNITVPA